jgi:hypothetical protein
MYLSLVRKYHNPLEIKSRIYISFQGRQKHARFNAEEFIYSRTVWTFAKKTEISQRTENFHPCRYIFTFLSPWNPVITNICSTNEELRTKLNYRNFK